ncbi:acyl transferase/acyl hydrolase/lysophospholipase [Calycina marina]|uniref:Acyl transferase/acyl hydrolase/lysophospholipase n=1 Tax=Calycina marina TaxID=1763456 RepID=A0A9P7Z9T6_9HELO|nr:acyl transferase/acyl hydrolase/lysophospholipase [Calycina marina]
MEKGGGMKRKDTTKGPPLRILSLDGGGVRGYSMFIIIQELMHRTYVEIHGQAPRRDQIPKPCDQFDMICGTGTGGLIAIMLGRLRLDLETCKEVYVRMTRKVFETDKTIAGIPYRSTLFKASKLEEAIKECVKEHTIFESEGRDGEGPDEPSNASPISPLSIHSRQRPQRHISNASVASFSARGPGSMQNRPYMASRWGNAEALLYDTRENRTKTMVTAIYKGTKKGGAPVLLRSYDSRKEPSAEADVKIWQAGRATCATGLAFKPMQIGQSLFIDEGAGQYNPSPFVLDEACVNEWPGRDVGVFISIGTGKRPGGSDNNKHLWYEEFMGDFAEARKRLISKIEGCEDTHQYMVKEGLGKRGVNIENYYRLNVEIGVGEFGMNEWHRLADISTGTKRYLGKTDVKNMNDKAAHKLGKIYRASRRQDRDWHGDSAQLKECNGLPNVPEAHPFAIELPAEVLPQPQYTPPSRPSYESSHGDALAVPGQPLSPRTSSSHSFSPPGSSGGSDPDRFIAQAPTPNQYRTAGGADLISIMAQDEMPHPPPQPSYLPPRIPQTRVEPPPLPPKTPIPSEHGHRGESMNRPKPPLPYPDEDGPPPVVNMAGKPNYKTR